MSSDPHPFCVALRARIATDVASGRPLGEVAADLVDVLADKIPGSTTIVLATEGESARIIATNAPAPIRRLVHDARRRRWFGSWGATLTRQGEVVVPDVAASSLYRDHAQLFTAGQMLGARAIPLRDDNNLTAGVVAFYLPDTRLPDDIETELIDEATSLVELAMRADRARRSLLERVRRDPLTGLENREGLEEVLTGALDRAANNGWAVALLFVDLDDLTLVNDSLGHTIGDTVIATTAERIAAQLLPGDAVVRFGGDEFIVVLERVDDVADADRRAERIRAEVGGPIAVADTTITPTVSIGITIGTADSSALELVDEGHAAVVRAKQGGRGGTAHHDRRLDTRAGARLGRENRLREALDHHEFVLHWQPKISLETGAIEGAEALIRWDHPESGLIGPDQFIPTAERSGMIAELSEWALWQAIREASDLAGVQPDFQAAVNLSASQLTRGDIVASIAESLETCGLDARHLIVELTESILANGAVTAHLHRLRRLGVSLAIDDFGTGYSSLAYVQQLPVQMVKIDRAFLGDLDAHGEGAPVLRAAVAMAHALGLTSTVEGVETTAQLAGLRTLGVGSAQGYLIAEALPQGALVELMLSDRRW